jgi:hypothetical protein
MLLERRPIRLLSEVLPTSSPHQFAAIQERLISLLARVAPPSRAVNKFGPWQGTTILSTHPQFGVRLAKVGRDDVDMGNVAFPSV